MRRQLIKEDRPIPRKGITDEPFVLKGIILEPGEPLHGVVVILKACGGTARWGHRYVIAST
jgi:hypothetical protein